MLVPDVLGKMGERPEVAPAPAILKTLICTKTNNLRNFRVRFA